jgi:hypothetical protein
MQSSSRRYLSFTLAREYMYALLNPIEPRLMRLLDPLRKDNCQ